MDVLAPETIARIFAFLDPRTLALCANVCRSWRTIVQLDTTWRTAFAVAFGLDEREAHIAARLPSNDTTCTHLRVAPALRRLAPTSWRAEFTERVALLRRWRKSRTPTVLSDPRIATLDALALSQSRRFVLSLSYGFSIASRSNAFTGKVAKDFLDASGFTTMAPNGQPNLEFSPATTALATDALATRVAWGQRSGEVSLTSIDWRGQSARGTVRNRAFARHAAHSAPVSAVAFPMPSGHGGAHGVQRSTEQHRQQLSLAGDAAPTFATAAQDGSVYIWHSKHDVPIWRGSIRRAPPVEDAPDDLAVAHLTYHPAYGVLLAASRSGLVCVWTHVECKALAALHNSRSARREPLSDADHAQCARLEQAHRMHLASHGAVHTLAFDTYDAAEDRVTFLVHTHGARAFVRYDVALRTSEVRTVVFGAPTISALTSIRCDFDVRERTQALPAALLVRMRAARFNEHKFVCAGTASGGIGVWEWDAAAPYDVETQRVWQHTATPLLADAQAAPALVLSGHTNAVTALDITPALVLAGMEDGTVKAIDPLTGSVVRVFNERTARRQPARMLASGELSAEHAARFRVNQIVADNELFVAAIGPQVLAWRTAEAAEAPAPEARGTPVRRARAADRPRMRMDLERAVQEEQLLLQAERQARATEQTRRDATHAALQGTLDDDAALDYALMLSREQAQQDELSYELLYDELRLDPSEGDSDAAPLPSPVLAALHSPPSRAWDTLQNAGPSASTTNEPNGTHSKLRTVAVPRHARYGTSPSSGPSSLSSTPLQLSSEHEWPDMRASAGSDRAARSPCTGAWANFSPVLRTADAPRSEGKRSALVSPACPSPSWHLDAPGEEEDAEMRLAMELSLAEYQSRAST